MSALKSAFIKTPNEVVARYKLSTLRQSQGQSIDDYLRALHALSADCNYKQVSADQHRQESVRGAFIAGLSSNLIRTRLLEAPNLTLEKPPTGPVPSNWRLKTLLRTKLIP